jgi:putative ubiquitin-RnfH superfamily antitoxin RatB of RatAB toxin-antitoxin module
MDESIKILLCDARGNAPMLSWHSIECHKSVQCTVGNALSQLGIALSADDERINRKGCFGVFGKRKDWDSPLYDGDRLELYQPLIVDPMQARRKKANKNKDARLQAKAIGRKGRFLSKNK